MREEQEDWLSEVSGAHLASEVLRLDLALDEHFRYARSWEKASNYLDKLAFEAIVTDTTPPGGIYGVGTLIDSERGYDLLAMFVVPDLVAGYAKGDPFETMSVWQTPLAHLLREYGVRVPKELLVVSLPMPQEQVFAGAPLECNSVRGTRGVEVRTGDGEVAVTTAGHVGDPTGATVTSGGMSVGVVGFTDRVSRHSSGELVADIAIVHTHEGLPLDGRPTISNVGVAKQLGGVVAYGQSGPRTGWVRSAMASFALRPGAGMWANVLLTDRAISSAGDSGAPVLLDDNSGTVIGHIVAGAPPAYSLIQDVSFALGEAGVTLA